FEDGYLPTSRDAALLLGLLAARGAVLRGQGPVSGVGIAVVIAALRRVHAGSCSDLLLSRLRLRYVVLLGTGVYALLVLTAEATVQRGSRAAGWRGVGKHLGL